jgi:NADPH:quinone reductase-like Zn-dependent oxidoreductase
LTLPHTLGFEIAVDVEEVGPGMTEFCPGERVSPLFQGAWSASLSRSLA